MLWERKLHKYIESLTSLSATSWTATELTTSLTMSTYVPGTLEYLGGILRHKYDGWYRHAYCHDFSWIFFVVASANQAAYWLSDSCSGNSAWRIYECVNWLSKWRESQYLPCPCLDHVCEQLHLARHQKTWRNQFTPLFHRTSWSIHIHASGKPLWTSQGHWKRSWWR